MSDIVEHDSQSVHTYLGILQSVINRMAANSTACKTWCITIVAATTVIIADKDRPGYIWIALFPILLFFFLDSYYLAQERCFRNRYNSFVSRLQSHNATVSDLYVMHGLREFCVTIASTASAFASVSIWPFYGLIIVMLLVVRFIIMAK